jgi:uncharacterized protein
MKTIVEKYPLIVYFMLAFAITWIGSTTYVLSLHQNGQVLPAFLGFPGMLTWYYGPFLAATLVTWISGGKPSLHSLLKRLLHWRVNWKWYAFILLYPPGLHLSVVLLDQLLGGAPPVFFQADGVPPGNVGLTLVGLILYQVLVRGIGEETGWRGFALPQLQARWSPVSSSLILGVLWGLWHFHPANFPALLCPAGIFILINITLTAFIFTWVYNHTRGSLWIAALFHMTLNIAEFVIPIGIAQASLSRHILQVALIATTAVVMPMVCGMRSRKGI